MAARLASLIPEHADFPKGRWKEGKERKRKKKEKRGGGVLHQQDSVRCASSRVPPVTKGEGKEREKKGGEKHPILFFSTTSKRKGNGIFSRVQKEKKGGEVEIAGNFCLCNTH